MIKLTLTAEQLEVIDGALEMYCMGLAEQNDPHLKYATNARSLKCPVINKMRPDLGSIYIATKRFWFIKGKTFTCCPNM